MEAYVCLNDKHKTLNFYKCSKHAKNEPNIARNKICILLYYVRLANQSYTYIKTFISCLNNVQASSTFH